MIFVSQHLICGLSMDNHTVSENKFCDPSNIHGNATKEVIIATESYQTLRRNSALKSTENEDRGGIWNEKSD